MAPPRIDARRRSRRSSTRVGLRQARGVRSSASAPSSRSSPPRSREALESRRRSRARRACSASSPRRTQRSTPSSAKLDGVAAHVRVRYLLERGRAFNSAGAPRARGSAVRRGARRSPERDRRRVLRGRRAHMLGIAAPPPERLDWNLKALGARRSGDRPARARLARLAAINNIGWTYFERGDAATALDYWQKALAAREATGDARTIARREVDGRARLPRRSAGSTTREAMQTRARRRDSKRAASPTATSTRSSPRSRSRAATPRRRSRGPRRRTRCSKDDPGLAANEPPRLARLAAIAGGKAPAQAVNPAKRRAIFERLRAANPNPTTELEHAHAVRAAGRRRAFGAGDRQGRQQGDREALPGRQHAGGDRRSSASTA